MKITITLLYIILRNCIEGLRGFDMSNVKSIFFSVAVSVFYTANSMAGFIVGPGNVASADRHAGSGDSINTDLSAPVNLAAGIYQATYFNYRFLDSDTLTVTGSITPILMTINKSDYTDIRPIAIGNEVNFMGTTSFMSTQFGGTDTFTLDTPTTVYAGFYWNSQDNSGDLDYRDPIPYIHGTGTNVVGYFNGAAAPEIGTPISAPSMGTDRNLFAFSIETAVVPAPSSLVLILVGGSCLFGGCWLRRSINSSKTVVAK